MYGTALVVSLYNQCDTLVQVRDLDNLTARVRSVAAGEPLSLALSLSLSLSIYK